MLATDEDLLQLPPKELVAIIRRLEGRIAEQDAQIAALSKQVATLTEAVRESHRSKAPFGKGTAPPRSQVAMLSPCWQGAKSAHCLALGFEAGCQL